MPMSGVMLQTRVTTSSAEAAHSAAMMSSAEPAPVVEVTMGATAGAARTAKVALPTRASASAG
jgi:hypothetical protein